MEDHLRDLEARYEEVTRMLATPEIATSPKLYQRYSKEHGQLHELVTAWRRQQDVQQELEDNREMLQDEDPEMRELAQAEIDDLTQEHEDLHQKIRVLLLPKDPLDEKNTILEIRAGTGGDEAGLFVSDLLRMYSRYAEGKRWKTEVLSSNPTDIGGFKEIIVLISGQDVYSRLKYESGVHRVQRVPSTESQGRVHTSACDSVLGTRCTR